MAEFRLGDVIDDWCVKCRRLTNHSVVSIVDGTVAKVRCRTCYHDHDYRHEEPPPSKKDQKKAALFNEVLATINPDATPAVTVEPEPEPEIEAEPEPDAELEAPPEEPAPAAPAKKRSSKRARGSSD